MAGVSYNTWFKVTREIFPTSVNFECTRIVEYNISLNETREIRFKVGGKNDDKKRDLKFELNNSNISLSTSYWSVENEWVIKTKVTGKKLGETLITVKVEGKTLNTIKIKCVDYKDVFSEKDVERLVEENKISISRHTACIIAADKQLGKLLLDNKNFITETSNNKANVYNAYTRIDQIKDYGFVKNFQIFEQSTFKGGGNYQPKEYNTGKQNVISNYLKNAIGSKIGYHVFYFTILNGYHVLLLVVNASNPCDMKFKIYDQLRDRGDYQNFSLIDDKLLEMNVNNWSGSASLTRDKTASTKFGIWKIQKK